MASFGSGPINAAFGRETRGGACDVQAAEWTVCGCPPACIGPLIRGQGRLHLALVNPFFPVLCRIFIGYNILFRVPTVVCESTNQRVLEELGKSYEAGLVARTARNSKKDVRKYVCVGKAPLRAICFDRRSHLRSGYNILPLFFVHILVVKCIRIELWNVSRTVCGQGKVKGI